MTGVQTCALPIYVTDAAQAKLAHDGFDPDFGARPLKRVIQRQIGDRAALAILEGRVSEGDTLTVDVIDDAYSVQAGT